MNLTPHFSLDELTHSQTADRMGIDNQPGVRELRNLRRTAVRLEQVRAALGQHPVFVSSGFRCLKLNTLIGGSASSDHVTGLAADFTIPGIGNPFEVCHLIAQSGIVFDKLIFEGRWIHLSVEPEHRIARETILSAQFRPGRKTRYLSGLHYVTNNRKRA